MNPCTRSEHSQRILERRKSLPVWQQKQEFLEMLDETQVMIIVGEAGSGKSTQIPQFVTESGYCDNENKILCTQPRRVAAISVAYRVAEEMNVTVGEQVGYTVPFESCSSAATILRYVTDDVILREATGEPMLDSYKAIIIDEAHERTLSTDLLCGLLKKKVLKSRRDLKVVVMSATMDAGRRFQSFFDCATLMKIRGRVHPVEIFYVAEAEVEYIEAVTRAVVQIHMSEPAGDVLVFLTGEEEIEEASGKIQRQIRKLGDKAGTIQVIQLHSSLHTSMLQSVFEPSGGRRIVLATDVAETSVTLAGISYVVDPGFMRRRVFNPIKGIESVLITAISKRNAQQRSLRACGGTNRGKCFRLYTEDTFHDDLEPESHPDILRSNLLSHVLTLYNLGVEKLFDYVDCPSPASIRTALSLLLGIGALHHEDGITSVGRMMAEFPLEPQMAKMLVASATFECSSEVLSLVAMLSAPSCFLRRTEAENDEAKARFAHVDGDHFTLINVYKEYDQNKENSSWCYDHFLCSRALKIAENVRTELVRIMNKLDLKICSTDRNSEEYYRNLGKCLLAGYPRQIARLESTGVYHTVTDGMNVHFHPSTVLKIQPEFVLYNDMVVTFRIFIRTITNIPKEWLLEFAPANYILDSETGKIVFGPENDSLDIWSLSKEIREAHHI